MYTTTALTLDADLLELEAFKRSSTFFNSRIKNNQTGRIKDYTEDYCFRFENDARQVKYSTELAKKFRDRHPDQELEDMIVESNTRAFSKYYSDDMSD